MGFDEENIGGELAVARLHQLVDDLGGFSMMFIVHIQQGEIDRAIDKDASFSKWRKGKGHRLSGAISARKVLVLFPRYPAWDAAFANANKPKQRIITGHGLGCGL